MVSKKEAGTIFISLQFATDKLQAGLRSLDSQFKKIGSTAQQAGLRMSLAFTVPLAAIGNSATKSFAEFDQAITNSIAFMGKAGDAMRKELEQGAMDVASTTTISAREAAEGYGILAQAGLSAAEAIKALPVVADFATAGQMRLADSSTTLVQIQKSLGYEIAKTAEENAEQLSKIGDVLTRASLDTTISIEDLSTALASQLGGSLRNAHVDLETAAAMLEAFGSQGIKGAKAGTALSIVIRELGRDFLKHSGEFRKLGIEVFDSTGNYRNMIDIIKDMEEPLSKMSDAQRLATLSALGFTERNRQYIQALLGMGDAMQIWRENNRGATGEMAAMAAKMRTTFLAQMTMAKNNIINTAIVLGRDLAPAVLFVTVQIVKLVKSFETLSPTVRYAIEGFVVLIGVLGPLRYAFGVIAQGVGALISLLSSLFAMITSVAGVLISVFGGWPLIISAALVGGTLAIVVFWDDVKQIVSNFINWFSETFPSISTVAQAVWIKIREFGSSVWDVIYKSADLFRQSLEWALPALGEFLITFWEGVKKNFALTWQQMGEIVDIFLSWFAERFPSINETAKAIWQEFKDFATEAFDYIAGLFERFLNGLTRIREGIKNGVQGSLSWANDVVAANNGGDNADAINKQKEANNKIGQIQSQIIQQVATAYDNVAVSANKATQSLTAKNQASQNAATANQVEIKTLEQIVGEYEGTSEKAQKAAKATERMKGAIEDLNEKLAEQKRTLSEDLLNKQLEQSIDNLDKVSFERISLQIAESVKRGSIEGLDDLIKKAGPANAKVAQGIATQIGETESQAALNEMREKWDKAAQDHAKELAEQEKQAHDDAIDFWRSSFSDAIKGNSNFLRQSLNDVLVGFAAELAASITSGISQGVSSMEDLGASLARSIGQGISSNGGGFGGIFDAIFGGGRPSGVQGPLLENGNFSQGALSQIFQGANTSAGYITAALSSVDALKRIGRSKKDTIEGASQAGFSAVGAFFGGPAGAMIGSKIGESAGKFLSKVFGGGRDPATKARKEFANSIEQTIRKLSTVAFFNQDKKLQVSRSSAFNVFEGNKEDFRDGSWATKLNSLGTTARNTFIGLGSAIKEVFELQGTYGEQLGYLLSETLGGDVDNARLLFQQLGLSLDDAIEKLVNVGLTGEKTWLEIETGIQGVSEAAKPGLVAVGDLKGAFQALIDSGGRGVGALKAVRDIAVEALEAGAKSVEEIRGRLLAEGFQAADVEALMSGLKQRGIETLQQLAEVSNRVGGGIVADINASSKNMADTWAKMSAQLDDVTAKLNSIPDKIESNITLNVDANITDSAQQVLDSGTATGLNIPLGSGTVTKFAKGGLINRKISFGMNGGIGIAGEAGPEMLMPAHRMPDGSLGVKMLASQEFGKGKSPINIYVNAPNATPGMEHKIVDALKKSQSQVIAQTIDAIERRQSRGGRYS